jgi:DNA-binding CsgD family transcriptional regulator
LRESCPWRIVVAELFKIHSEEWGMPDLQNQTRNGKAAADKFHEEDFVVSLSISAPASIPPANAPAPAPTATKQTLSPQLSADTVTLSLSAQVIQLNQQGQQPSQIAANLGISVSTVNSDLGIAASTST